MNWFAQQMALKQRMLGEANAELEKSIGNAVDQAAGIIPGRQPADPESTEKGQAKYDWNRHPLMPHEEDDAYYVRAYLDYITPSDGRLERYKEYDEVEAALPEVGTALNYMASYVTSGSMIEEVDSFTFKCPDERRLEEVKAMEERLKLRDLEWVRTRHLCKYGDHFAEVVADPGGLSKIAPRPVKTMFRIEDDRGTLRAFCQKLDGKDPVHFKPWQIAHSRLQVDDAEPYGQSVLYGGVSRLAKILELSFDGLTIARLTNSHDRFKWKVDVSHVPPTKQLEYLRDFRKVQRKRRVIDPSGRMSLQNNPLRAEEDLFVPVSKDSASTDVDRIAGDSSMTRINDIEMQYERFFVAMQMHVSWFLKGAAFDASANAAITNFTRLIRRIRKARASTLVSIYKLGLILGGAPQDEIEALKLEIVHPQLSHSDELMRLKVEEVRAGIMAQYKDCVFFPLKVVLTKFGGYTEEEADKYLQDAEVDRKKLASEQQAAQSGGIPGMDNPTDAQPENIPLPESKKVERLADKLLHEMAGYNPRVNGRDSTLEHLMSLVTELRDLADLVRTRVKN
jgi:hypothetical protein